MVYVIVIRILVAGLATKNFDDLPLALGFPDGVPRCIFIWCFFACRICRLSGCIRLLPIDTFRFSSSTPCTQCHFSLRVSNIRGIYHNRRQFPTRLYPKRDCTSPEKFFFSKSTYETSGSIAGRKLPGQNP
jgi:hypothetical protein